MAGAGRRGTGRRGAEDVRSRTARRRDVVVDVWTLRRVLAVQAGVVRNPAFGFTLRRGVCVVPLEVFVLIRCVHDGYSLSLLDCFRE